MLVFGGLSRCLASLVGVLEAGTFHDCDEFRSIIVCCEWVVRPADVMF